MKKLFIAFLGLFLFISCSSDDDKNKNIEFKKEVKIENESILLKDNISNKNYSLSTGYIEEKGNNSFFQENTIKSSNGLDGKVLVNYDGNKLYTITSEINEMSFFIEKINEKEFYVLDSYKNKIQKILVTLDNSSNMNIKTLEIYKDKNNNALGFSTRGRWYDCMRDRLSDPINIMVLGFSSYLGPAALAGGFSGIGIYCLF